MRISSGDAALATRVAAIDRKWHLVIIDAASLSGKVIGAAISSSVAHRPSGIASRNGPHIVTSPIPRRHWRHHHCRVDAVGPDVVLPSSNAETRVMLSTAAFDEPYEM